MAFQDLFTFAAAVFVIGAVILVGYTGFSMLTDVNIGAYSVDYNYTSPDGSTVINPAEAGEQMFGVFDWGFLLLAVAFILGMFYSGFLIQSHPIFTVVGLVLAIVWFLVAPLISNSWLMLVQGTVLQDAAENFVIVHTFMMNLPIIGLFAGVITSVLLYGKGVPRT